MAQTVRKIKSKFLACIEANRLKTFINDKSLLPVYASSTAKILPYQIAAARFALRSDYLKGCIFCDEASLGKTYEALLIAGQMWYEGKENIIVILPSNLITQWMNKLQTDFTIPFVFWNNTKEIPQEDGIVITTYDCAVRRADKIKEKDWDLAIFDEADVLANRDKESTMILKDAVREAYKLLLTPTPITKDIRDIYGLIHFIDESVLPDADWFYKRYFRKPENYPELTAWVSQFCFRSLKAQTTEYVNFSRRIPITVDYPLIKEEKELYKLISTYIASDNKAAYPEMDGYNLNLLFFKTLSSSTQAFVKMLNAPIQRSYGIEKAVLLQMQKLADSIKVNSKTTQLLKILKTVFNHLKSMKVNQKAIIFVENSATLDVLYQIFRQNDYETIKYKNNESLELFRKEKDIQILITTDIAAKGLDIEYCPVVVNYDLLYNAIEMEQRICRCHRQGQRSDVLVINMLSRENFTDVRILELINKRTLQFNGIFGMSDDIVGNFDTKIKEVLKNFRHRDEVAVAFKENLTEHRQTNDELVENYEDILFTTFTKSIADKVTVSPKYIEEKVDEINNDLWELVKYYFTEIDNSYKVNEQLKMLERLTLDKTFDYYTGKQHKYYAGREKYGLSKELPYYERLTYTSPLAKSIFYKFDWRYYSKNAILYTDADIEPCRIGFYDIDVVSRDGYLDEQNFLIGQTLSGEILSEKKCMELLGLPVVNCIEPDYEMWRQYSFEFAGAGNLELKIPKDEIIKDYISRKQGSFEYEVEKIKLLAGRKKTQLEADLNDLKTQIKGLKKKIDNGASNKLEELKIIKQIKIFEKELLKHEEGLFLAKAEIDIATEKEIEELTQKNRFEVNISPQFIVQIYPEAKSQITEIEEHTPFMIKPQY